MIACIVCLAILGFDFISALNFTCNTTCLDLYLIDTLLFSKDHYSEGPDGSTYPQLICNGGNACSESSDISAIDCKNDGEAEDGNVIWKCLPQDTYETLYISNIDVQCDGYRYPEDPQYVFAQSCRLQFALDDSVYDNKNDDDLDTDDKAEVTDTTNIGRLLIVIFALIFMCIMCVCCNKGWGYYYPKSYRATQMYEYIDEPILSPVGSYQGMPVVHNTLIQPPEENYGSYQQMQPQQAWTGPGWYGGGVEIIDIQSGGTAGSWSETYAQGRQGVGYYNGR